MIIQPFSQSIYISDENYSFNEKELNFLQKIKKIKNTFNIISENKQILDNEEFLNLKNWLQKNINHYLNNIMSYKDVKCYFTQSWLNWTHQNEKHGRHRHVNSFLSGVIYFTENDAEIIFYRKDNLFVLSPSIKEYNIYNSDSLKIETKKGRLILFPSLLNHEVGIQNIENTRISLAFNTWLKGDLGEEKMVNFLKL